MNGAELQFGLVAKWSWLLAIGLIASPAPSGQVALTCLPAASASSAEPNAPSDLGIELVAIPAGTF